MTVALQAFDALSTRAVIRLSQAGGVVEYLVESYRGPFHYLVNSWIRIDQDKVIGTAWIIAAIYTSISSSNNVAAFRPERKNTMRVFPGYPDKIRIMS